MKRKYKLSVAPPGKYVIVELLSDGVKFNRRLANLGLVPSTELKVLKRQRKGAIMIKVRGSKYAIGYGRAERIAVVEI